MNELPMKTKLTTRERITTLAGITLFGLALSSTIGKQLVWQALLTALIIWMLTGRRPQILFAALHTLSRDLRAAKRYFKLTGKLILWDKTNRTVAETFRQMVARHPDKPAFLIEDKIITFQEAEDLSNRIGNYFKSKDYRKGDTIALLMETRLEYTSLWLGLSKISVITALININLRRETLIHSIRIASSKAIIVSVDLLGALAEIMHDEDIGKLQIYVYDPSNAELTPLNGKMPVNLYRELQLTSASKVDISKCMAKDKLLYIYTSGTTGMPKAAVITNLRFQYMVCAVYTMLGLGDEIIYNTLPLYHTAGGMIGAGMVHLFGVTMALRKKFSASNFWSDCVKYNCTVAQYIGEICRFLLLTPPKPEETQHKIRLMFGNGVRPQIWSEFVQRFKIEQLAEAYGATESNANLINLDNTRGAIGFVPQAASFLYPVDIIRCDEDTAEPIRGPDGLCIRCEPGEAGVFVGKIMPSHASRSFAGYADKAASAKKVIRDVYKRGDQWFNSSDILVMDLYGYFYFKDRTGDTFRWRGENVSSTEVEDIIMKLAGLSDCVVYGVEVPENEGKAGMAAIVDPDDTLDLKALAVKIKDTLPPYARPIFIRTMKELPMTGTFKLKKRDLQLEGFDINKIKDSIYIFQKDSYQKLAAEKYEEIKSGRAKM